MIRRAGESIIIEQDPSQLRKVLLVTIPLATAIVIAIVVVVFTADLRPVEYLTLVPVGGLTLFFAYAVVTHRPALVIAPNRLEALRRFGGRVLWSEPRERVGWVELNRYRGRTLQVLVMDKEGNLLRSPYAGSFPPEDVRKAFEMAGISVR